MDNIKNKWLEGCDSAYLKQHVEQEIEWRPWGKAAFDLAKRENKLIFLNIGSATCHSCHRMDEESFKIHIVAKSLNDNYVSIIVDRDERPDIDAVFYLIVQAMTKRSGMPMNIIMTPEGKPFFSATYLPLEGYQNVPGIRDVFPAFAEAWKNDPETLRASAKNVEEFMKNFIAIQEGEKPNRNMLRKGRERLELIYDMIYGGYGPAPKFLMPHSNMFMMLYNVITEDNEGLGIAQKTMLSQYKGGIYDHIGGGFFHYSTDPVWMIPSFEKLCSDNAMMALAFAQAAKYRDDSMYYRIVREILTFMLRDLTNEDGLFYHGLDADFHGEDGLYYGWHNEETKKVLDFEAEMFDEYYNIGNVGNLPNGTTLPNLLYQELDEKKILFFKKHRNALFEERNKRDAILRDEKILASDNGLSIGALAYSWRCNGQEEFLLAAEKAADYIINHFMGEGKKLFGCYYNTGNHTDATAFDYAAMVWGLYELYQADWNMNYLKAAVELQDEMIHYLWDDEGKGFFAFVNDGTLPFVPKHFYDAELPCDNSLAAYNLMRLGRLVGRKDWKEKAGEMLTAFGGEIIQNPTACSFWLYSICYWLSPGNQFYVFGDVKDQEIDEMRDSFKEFILIDWSTMHAATCEEQKEIGKFAPAILNFTPNFETGEAFIGRGFEYAKKGVDDSESVGMSLSNYTYEPGM